MAARQLIGGEERRSVSRSPRSRAFFLELLLNMFIFAVCAVVVLQVFAESQLTTSRSAATAQLSLDAEALAENFKASGGEPGAQTYYYDSNLELLFVTAVAGGEDAVAVEAVEGASDTGAAKEVSVAPDVAVAPTPNTAEAADRAASAAYRLVLTPAPSTTERVSTVSITGYAGQTELFTFTVSAYEPPQGGR
jgi:Tfp pilus assembly protein PilE